MVLKVSLLTARVRLPVRCRKCTPALEFTALHRITEGSPGGLWQPSGRLARNFGDRAAWNAFEVGHSRVVVI